VNETIRTASVLAAAALIATAGCGTTIHGTKQAVPLASVPPGATATWNGQAVETPGSMVIPRAVDDVRIRFEKQGMSRASWPSIGTRAGGSGRTSSSYPSE